VGIAPTLPLISPTANLGGDVQCQLGDKGDFSQELDNTQQDHTAVDTGTSAPDSDDPLHPLIGAMSFSNLKSFSSDLPSVYGTETLSKTDHATRAKRKGGPRGRGPRSERYKQSRLNFYSKGRSKHFEDDVPDADKLTDEEFPLNAATCMFRKYFKLPPGDLDISADGVISEAAEVAKVAFKSDPRSDGFGRFLYLHFTSLTRKDGDHRIQRQHREVPDYASRRKNRS
jgi:hypothetical protein